MAKESESIASSNAQQVGSLSELAEKLVSRLHDNRTIVAIAGAPGSGKTTISDLLQTELESQHHLSTQIVPMDGFHFDNAVLQQRGLISRKGSPQTFDIHGLENILLRLKNSPSCGVTVPVFDRENDLSRASARDIKQSTRVILVEGNYLLLDVEPWNALKRYFDITIMINCDEPVLRKRLTKRWLDLDFTETEARQKVERNDLPNAQEVIDKSRKADITFTSARD